MLIHTCIRDILSRDMQESYRYIPGAATMMSELFIFGGLNVGLSPLEENRFV